jgi:D-arabinose 1-dehydrogenase-like Zn-dependent alcohol dehydrogenase
LGDATTERITESVPMIPRMMKASIFEIYGDASVLKFAEVPTPVPGRDEALVKVHAVGLNGYDLMARSGRYKPNKGKFPHILRQLVTFRSERA